VLWVKYQTVPGAVEVLIASAEALEKEDAIKMFDINVITPLIASVPVIKQIIASMPGRRIEELGPWS
jgi:hypothetical protein